MVLDCGDGWAVAVKLCHITTGTELLLACHRVDSMLSSCEHRRLRNSVLLLHTCDARQWCSLPLLES
jgi:hypothetical protein